MLQVNSKLPHALFLSWDCGAAVPAVNLAVGAEAGEISNVEKLQLWCWHGLTVVPEGVSHLHRSSGSQTPRHRGVVDGWLELGAAVSKFKRAVQSRQIGCGEASRDPQYAVCRGRMPSEAWDICLVVRVWFWFCGLWVFVLKVGGIFPTSLC